MFNSRSRTNPKHLLTHKKEKRKERNLLFIYLHCNFIFLPSSAMNLKPLKSMLWVKWVNWVLRMRAFLWYLFVSMYVFVFCFTYQKYNPTINIEPFFRLSSMLFVCLCYVRNITLLLQWCCSAFMLRAIKNKGRYSRNVTILLVFIHLFSQSQSYSLKLLSCHT